LEAKQLAKILSRLGLVFLALFAVLMAVDSLPLKLLEPDWILNTSATLVNLVTIPLVGVVLIHLSGYFSPSTHLQLHRRVARLAALLSLLFLLILPMLGLAVVRNARNLDAANQRTLQAISKKGSDLRQAVQSASSFTELKMQMQRLNGPQIGTEAQSIPLPELKKQLLQILGRAEAAVPTQMIQANSPSLLPVYKRVFRTSLLSLVGAIGFGLLAWDPVKKQNIFLEYVKSFKLFGASPGSLRGSLVKTFNDYQERRKRDSDVAGARDSSVRRERELRKLKAQQERDQKRNMQERRKQGQRMKRQAEQRDKRKDWGR